MAGIDIATLQRLMSEVVQKSTEGLRDGITAVTRENTTIKASQARLESQRRRVNDVGKSEGKTVSLAKQLDFTEDLLASLEGIKELGLGLVLDKPACPVSPAGPAPPSQAVCKITDYKDGALLHERLEELILSSKAKLKELNIVWSAPSYRVAFEAIRGYDNSDGAVGEDALKEISEAVSRVEKANKRKEQPGWEESANKAVKPGGWGSNYSAQGQEPAQTGGWGQLKAVLLLRLGTVAKAKARAAKARARPRSLLLVVLLLLLLVAMLLLLISPRCNPLLYRFRI